MHFQSVKPHEWLTDDGLTQDGREARKSYGDFCAYLQENLVPSFKSARTKYFLQAANYWTLPDGFALPPHTINVCVNNLCNLKCKYCDFGQGNEETFYHEYNVVEKGKNIELPLELCKSIVDQVEWFRPIIRASFREPLLYSEILPFIEYTKSKNLPFWLLTNGFLLKRYARDLVSLGVDSIRLSLDGPSHIHDAVRGVKNSHSRMMEGVKILLEECQKANSDMQVGFYFTLNDSNYEYISETVEELHREGILDKVFINFQWLLYTTEEMARRHNEEHAPVCGGSIQESTIQSVDIFKIDLKNVSEQAQRIQQRFPAEKGYRIHFRPSFTPEDLSRYRDTEKFPLEAPRCKMLWYNMNINPAAEVKSFHHCLMPVTGNVSKTQVLDVWNGTEFRKQRKQLQEYGAFHGCSRCWGVYALLEDQKRKS